MRKSMVVVVLLFPLIVGTTWLGCRWLAPVYVPYRYSCSVEVTCGGGNYSKDTFRIINDELQRKLVDLMGYRDGSEHLVAVLPGISGYKLQMFGPPGSKLGEKNLGGDLADWIHTRMEAVEMEVSQEALRVEGERR